MCGAAGCSQHGNVVLAVDRVHLPLTRWRLPWGTVKPFLAPLSARSVEAVSHPRQFPSSILDSQGMDVSSGRCCRVGAEMLSLKAHRDLPAASGPSAAEAFDQYETDAKAEHLQLILDQSTFVLLGNYAAGLTVLIGSWQMVDRLVRFRGGFQYPAHSGRPRFRARKIGSARG